MWDNWEPPYDDGWPLESPGAPRAAEPAEDCTGSHLYIPPALWRWMVSPEVHVQGVKPPTLCCWYEADEGVWKGVLHNRAKKCSLFRSADTLEELVVALNDALHQEPAGWKRDRSAL